MKEIVYKRYDSFTEFNKDGCYLAEYIKNNAPETNSAAQIKYARKVFSSSILNSFIVIGYISEEIKKLLNCSKCELKFSMDNMIKNRLSHPDVMYEDYEKIPAIIKSPSKYYRSKSKYNVILFKELGKYYKLVIKTTKNRKENFIKSLHLLNADRYHKY